MIDRNSPLPIYYQLKLLIKQQIESGLFKPGNQLLTEQELCERYGISRAPVRQALAELVQEGSIYRRAGMGTFLSGPAEQPEQPRTRFKLLANDVRWDSLLERTVRYWNAQNPGHEIYLDVEMPPPSEFHQALQSATAQGNAPDLVAIDYVWVTGYAHSSYLAALDELDPALAQWLQQDLEQSIVRNHSINGHFWGLPMQADVTGLWYRRDWFEADGLTPPTTWDEWLALLEHFADPAAMSRFGHRYPVAFPCGTTTGEVTVNVLLPFIWGAGGDVLDAQGNLTLADESVYRALRFLRSIVFERKYLPPNAVQFGASDAAHMMARGEVPMTLGGTYEWPFFREESDWETEEDLMKRLGFVPSPRPTAEAAPVVSLGGTTWVILEQSKLKELSLKLMQLAISSDWITDFHAETLQLSPFKEVNRAMAETHPWIREILPFLSVARPRPMIRPYLRVSRFLQQMFERILWHGAAVEEAVNQTAIYLSLLLGDPDF